MPLKLMYITNRPDVARIAEQAGVDWVFVDLETLGKAERQGHLDSVKSHHTVEDIRAVRSVLSRAEVLVRINPIHEGSPEEIEAVLAAGADIIMLPMWKTEKDVSRFFSLVGGRCRTILLLETKEAEQCLEKVLRLPDVDMVHIGLNDLHLSYGRSFMFEMLADGTVERICARLKEAGVPYGFGGVGRPGTGLLPAEHILGEHVRLGSGMVILSRSFCDVAKVDSLEEIRSTFTEGVGEIRAWEAEYQRADAARLEENRKTLCGEVAVIAGRMRERKP